MQTEWEKARRKERNTKREKRRGGRRARVGGARKNILKRATTNRGKQGEPRESAGSICRQWERERGSKRKPIDHKEQIGNTIPQGRKGGQIQK